MSTEHDDRINQIPFNEIKTSTLGEIPPISVPKVTSFEGREPRSLSAYSRIVKKLNNGIPLRDAIKHAEEIKILFRDSNGWKVAAGTILVLGGAITLATVTRKIIRDSRKPR